MTPDIERLRETERWIAWVRLAAVPFAIVEVGLLSTDYPPGYESWAWATTGLLAVAGVGFYLLSRGEAFAHAPRRIGMLGLTVDTVIVAAFVVIFQYEIGSPVNQLFFVLLVEAAVRYGIRGGLLMPLAIAPLLALAEWWRESRFDNPPHGYQPDHVVFPWGLLTLTGMIVGWLVDRLRQKTATSEAQVVEAELLRDELGRRADVLEAATRCARALSSSLDLDEAFEAFIRELRGLVPFDRMAIVLEEAGAAQVMAVAGIGAEVVFSRGSRQPVGETLLSEILRTGQPIYREDMTDARYSEEREFGELGLRCRIAAPLLHGPRAFGMISLVRRKAKAFNTQELELVALLGRLVASAVQNIRAYEAEHSTVEELRRLSALRADFVSLVSHELRAPMASVVGSAQTLRQRWRELNPDQRESFLALIGSETERLAALVGDVLDTSRIDAGTFTYRFADVDLGALVRDSVAGVSLAQDEVSVVADVHGELPSVRGDRDRLQQVLTNLLDNAVKFSPAGEEVTVNAFQQDSRVRIEVSDRGPGVPADQQRVIFEKFGRGQTAGSPGKPGTGLGLFIARSIAEAHGGVLEVSSAPNEGATFTLSLPVDTVKSLKAYARG
ncbi:MAG: HAMP domain-containing histidine kinase [Actinobacteria bacterium]|nr:MAG: HAMP domain-containing histidine kinase [Actinomycetota bacterium]